MLFRSGGWSDSSGGNISSGGWTSGSGNNNTLGGWTSGSSNNNSSTGRNITSGTIMRTPYDHTLQPQYTLSYCSPPPPPPPPSGGSSSSGSSSNNTQGTGSSTTGTGGGCESSQDAARDCMQANHEAWHTASDEEKRRLEEENVRLSGIANATSDGNGGWNDSNNGNPITNENF